MPKYKVTTLNALGLQETRTLTAERVAASEHYVALESGAGSSHRIQFLAPREKLVVVEETT